jgi:hypothetical protein
LKYSGFKIDVIYTDVYSFVSMSILICDYYVRDAILKKTVMALAFSCISLGSQALNNASAVLNSNILEGTAGNIQTNVLAVTGPTDSSALSLGGTGGWIVVELETSIVDGVGADLEVREIGAVEEKYLVSVSETNEAGSYIQLGEGIANSQFDVSGLGLPSIKYVRIDDLSTQTLDTEYPGSDIDSISVLNSSSGGSSDVMNLVAELRNTGIIITWDPITDESITGYAVRSSTDGVTYFSAIDWNVSKFEHALRIDNISEVKENWYSVSPLYSDGTEGISSIASLNSIVDATLITSDIIHLGDGLINSWDEPESVVKASFSFELPYEVKGPIVKLELDVFNVHYENKIVINGYSEVTVPVSTPSEFSSKILILNSDTFKQGTNVIEFYALDSQGDTISNLDDYQITNIKLTYYN